MRKHLGQPQSRSAFSRLRLLGAASLAIAGLIAGCGGDGNGGFVPADTPTPPPPTPFTVAPLSTAPNLISGGDTRVRINLPDGVSASNVRVTLNGNDVTDQLSLDEGGATMSGLITGLCENPAVNLPVPENAKGCDNTLEVSNTAVAAQKTSITLTNFPITGPVLSGPHLMPYECRLTQNNLTPVDPANADGNCSAVTQVDYFYRTTNSATYQPLTDLTAYPANLAETTTSDGVTVKYIVRVESGTINRGVYRLSVLDDPIKSPTAAGKPWQPGEGWNHKAIASFGCCGGANYNQGVLAATPQAGISSEVARGFAYVNSSEMWNQQHANAHLQGETLMMLKEHIIDTFGPLKWMAGVGGSGGSIQQYLIAQMYPGLLDGIQPSLSFPDSAMSDVQDCRLLVQQSGMAALGLTTDQRNAVYGFTGTGCLLWDLTFANIIKSDSTTGATNCGFTDPANQANIFNRATNPNGVRCDLFQTNVNLLGVRLGTESMPQGGEARRTLDNVGLQYGFVALQKGTITLDQFLAINEQVGGYDRDGNLSALRSVADKGSLRMAYEGGMKNSFRGPGLANIPIITSRSNANAAANDIHDALQDQLIRARLQKAQGRSDNQIILAAGSASPSVSTKSLDLITEWLDNIVAKAPAFADRSTDLVVQSKPDEAKDTCWANNAAATPIYETASTNPNDQCNQLYPKNTTPRIAAGAPMDESILKCQLKPLNPDDYYPATFSIVQWNRLNAIFPYGVCDWSKPGEEYVEFNGSFQQLPLADQYLPEDSIPYPH
jgi:hypothetical protein